MRALRIPIIIPAFAAAAWLAVAAPVSAQTTTCPAIPVDCLQPAPLAQIEGARFAWGSTGGEAPDAWVARFDRESKEPTWRVLLGGSGIDAVATVTLSPGGTELLVAGSTTSPTVTGFAGRSSGGRDGFVARLNAGTGYLLSGAFVGGAGNEELSGVAADGAGNILVAGVGALPALGAPPATLTVVEPSSAAGLGSPAFLATLDGALAGVQARYNLGNFRVKRPRVWIDCQGNIVVGVTTLGGGNCNGNWPDLIYEQDQIAQDYLIDHDWNDPSGNLGSPPGGWGYHALRWKEYQANAGLPVGDPPYVLDWALRPTGVDIPKDWVTCADAATLNQLETAIYLKNGVATNPPGGWMCGDHTDRAQLSLYAAHLFNRWGTPVYTMLGEWDNISGPWVWQTDAAGLERVRFRPFCIDPDAYNGETIDDLCDLDVNSVDDLTCTTSSGIPGVDGGDFFLRVEEFEGAVWGRPLVWWLRPFSWLSDFDWWYEEWYEPGEYLMDPPLGSENEVAIVQEAARQSSGRVVRSGNVKVTRIANGAVACQQTLEAVIPASE